MFANLGALHRGGDDEHRLRVVPCLSDRGESVQVGKHRGTLHDTPDVADTLRPYTLFSRNVSTIEEFHDSLEEAYTRWATDRPRPVYLGVPLDVLASEVGDLPQLRASAPPKPREPAPSELEAVTQQLVAAESPAIIAGGGCRNYGGLLKHLAELLDAPVLPTANSKGLLEEDHPLNLDLSIPFAGTRTLLQEADAVLAIGTELSDVEYIFTGADPVTLRNLIRVDLDPNVSHADQIQPVIRSDAGMFIEALLPLIGDAADGVRRRSGATRVTEAKRDWAGVRQADPYREWFEALHRGLPENAIVAADSAQLAYQAHQFMPLPAGTTWMSPYGFGTLGPALPMAVGAAVSAPERPVIALAGDGSSLFTIAELATAADLGRQLTLVIWVNDGYKEIEASFKRAAIPPVGVGTSAANFSAIARGLGAHVLIALDPSEFERAIREAMDISRVTVIVVEAPGSLRVGAES